MRPTGPAGASNLYYPSLLVVISQRIRHKLEKRTGWNDE